MSGNYNVRNPAVKRLMREAVELKEPTELYYAQPVDDNLFEWHFTVRGPPDTDFDGGIYHGRVSLPSEYPMKPPSIMLLTPNGRFELNKKICLSISGYHPESWRPSWSIRTALLAIIGFMPTHGAGAIGSLEYPPEERKKLAKKSQEWRCDECDAHIRDILPPLTEASKTVSDEAKELASQIEFKDEKEVKKAVEAAKESEESAKTPEDPNETEDNQEGTSPSQMEESTPSTEASTLAEARDREMRRRITEMRNRLNQQPVRVGEQQNASASVVNSGGGTANLVMIGIVSMLIAALLFRRLYMANEWRFH